MTNFAAPTGRNPVRSGSGAGRGRYRSAGLPGWSEQSERPGGPRFLSVLAQAPAAVAALDEAQACQLSQAPQHGVEVHSGLDRDGGGPGTAAGGQRVEHPGAVGGEIVTGGRIAVTEERAVVAGRKVLAPRPGVGICSAPGASASGTLSGESTR